MRIYIDGIIYSLQKGGGITRYTDELINGLIESGHEVILFIHPKTCNRLSLNKKIKIIEIKSILKTNNKITRLFTYPFHKLMMEKYFKKNKTTGGIFHSTYFTHYNNLKIPQFITIHDLTREKFPQYFKNFNNKIFLFLNKQSILKSDKIICVSKQTASDLIKYYKVDPKKIKVTHLGVNNIFTTKTEEEKITFKKLKNIKKQYIFFVGRRSLYKNFENFIKAFANWEKKDNFSIITIGGEDVGEKEKKLIEQLNLKNFIINYKFTTDEDLVMFYNCASCFVFPSLSEGFGLPLLEAMACGTPIAASNLPVFYEIAKDIPYYFEPLNSESIIKALDNSLIREDKKIQMGLNLVKTFSWENTIKETVSFYNQ